MVVIYKVLLKKGFNLMKVVSSNGDFMEVNAIPINNKKAKEQNHIYNIFVKVKNSKKYFSGLCVNSNVQRVKGIFQTEYRHKGVRIKKKRCPKHKRANIKRRCKRSGIRSKFGLLRCIIDVCYHMRPLIEVANQMVKKEIKLQKVKKIISIPKLTPRKPGTCYSLGDPHYRTFGGKFYDNFWVGDFILSSTKDFTVHARTRKYNRASVNKRFSANLNGDIIEAKSANKFRLNGESVVELKVGQKYKLPKGGVVHRISENRSLYYSFKAGFLDAEFLGAGSMKYVNLIVKVPNFPDATGACQGKMIEASGLFKKKSSYETKKTTNENFKKMS